jgi:hypothetical protein
MPDTYLIGLFPRAALHERCAGARGEVLSPAMMWSACHGSVARYPPPHRWQVVAPSLMPLLIRLYVELYSSFFFAIRAGLFSRAWLMAA